MERYIEHYFDWAATSPADEDILKEALEKSLSFYANPSSQHSEGAKARKLLEDAREKAANVLGVKANNLFFTSGGTESNHIVLLSLLARPQQKGSIVISAIEHPSIREQAQAMKNCGWEVISVNPDKSGIVSAEAVKEKIRDDTALVCVMAVNNETGSIQPTEAIAKRIKRRSPEALFHVDAVQAFCKTPLKPLRWGVDFMTVSAHKIHGPKGVGAILIRDGARMIPLLYGGEQQHKTRPGTESAPLIAAFGEAVKEADISANLSYIRELNDYAVSGLKALDGVTINSPASALPYIINISVKGIRSETMLHHLEQSEVYVSSSSACAKGKRSYVLAAMGLSDDRIDSSIRISFSKYNTRSDIDALIKGLESGIKNLQRK